MPETAIGWSDHTLNFYSWNCHKISPGCKNCYAAARAQQFGFKNSAGGQFMGIPQWRESAVDELRKTPSGTVVFVNSHSDTFHEKIELPTLKKLFAHLSSRPDVIFLLLTKRPFEALKHGPYLNWTDNIWLGTSVESSRYLPRVTTLSQTPAKHRFISFEPLLDGIATFEAEEAVRLVDWAIVGGESGDGRRPFNKLWARAIRDACEAAQVPFFFKQGGAHFAGNDRELEGKTYDELPPQFAALKAQHEKPIQQSLF